MLGLLVGAIILGVIESSGPGPRGKAPDFELERAAGGMITLGELKGQAVVVTFWATWCGPCQIELPQLVAMVGALRNQGVTLVAINEDERDDAHRAVPAFLKGALPGLNPYVAYGNAETAAAYGLQALPTLFVVDPKGKIVGSSQGLTSPKRVRQWVDQALKER